jgi:hypothetical protein
MFESGPMVSMLIRVHDLSIVMGKTLVVGFNSQLGRCYISTI